MITNSESLSFPPPTLFNGASHHQQDNGPDLCSFSPYDLSSSQSSYAILPLSPLPLSSPPSDFIHKNSNSTWTYHPSSDTRWVANKKPIHPDSLPSPNEQQQLHQKRLPRSRNKLWQPSAHRQPNTLTKTIWADEGTVCYQVEAKGICVTRRGDNSMVNGTKLLNAVGMSRGKRDGILKNVRGRRVVKVGSMVLKGVWIAIEDARELATKFVLEKDIYPLLEPCPDRLLVCGPSSLLLPSPSSPSPGTVVDSSNPYSHNRRHQLPALAQAAASSVGAPRGVPLSPGLQQLGQTDAILDCGDAERDYFDPMQRSPPPPLSSLSPTTSFTGTESAATAIQTYHLIQTPLPPASYFHPYMMYNFLPKYPTATIYNEHHEQLQQHQKQQTDFNHGAYFLAQ